jgi:hypothetical protein
LRWSKLACRRSRRWIALYLDRELRELELAVFQAHVNQCVLCRTALLDQWRFLRGVRMAGTGPKAPAGLRARVERILGTAFGLMVAAGVCLCQSFG